MEQATHHRSILADLVDFSAQMDLDATMESGDLRHRDRSIGRELEHLVNKPRSQLRQWLWRVAEDKQNLPGNNAVKTLRLITLVLFFLGITAGWITALGVFAYDGTQPVNVVNVLAVFVGLQILLLLMSAIMALPQNILRFIPGARSLQDLFGVLSPGRLAPTIARFLSPDYRLAFEAILGRQKAHHITYGRVKKWLILQLSQVFAVAFNVGALFSCLYLVTISDLAFGWSTTLAFQAEKFHWWVQQLAWPWRDWLGSAVPSANLIEVTRFYRLDEGILPNAMKLEPKDASTLGQWWQFLLLAIIFYGLLPRLFTLAFARWRLNIALNNAFIHAPGATQVLDRMNHAMVETTAVEPEARAVPMPEVVSSFHTENFAGVKGYLVNWAGINLAENQLENALRVAMAVKIDQVLHAGGKSPIEQDQRVIGKLQASEDTMAIVVAVKSWEPPLLDLLDFLEALRSALGPQRLITVIPLALNHKGNLVSADSSDLDIWRKKLQSLGDPQLDFRPLNFEAS
ncbi:DUF2868 domain-containing protein [Nitrosococcus watsonii]|uniref:DUF2868 domain-containing protein n=1 Tax=Nitrosococcus watsoni (strain C-113) TaxID=105559 RepID=D8K472_NITWC|nr:DUF2868 domain-containing protein [Nitrosococcus watsonii]ADJ27769.1 conserved hypothetical protein [Nitrosococcus watsonii C-113]